VREIKDTKSKRPKNEITNNEDSEERKTERKKYYKKTHKTGTCCFL